MNPRLSHLLRRFHWAVSSVIACSFAASLGCEVLLDLEVRPLANADNDGGLTHPLGTGGASAGDASSEAAGDASSEAAADASNESAVCDSFSFLAVSPIIWDVDEGATAGLPVQIALPPSAILSDWSVASTGLPPWLSVGSSPSSATSIDVAIASGGIPYDASLVDKSFKLQLAPVGHPECAKETQVTMRAHNVMRVVAVPGMPQDIRAAAWQTQASRFVMLDMNHALWFLQVDGSGNTSVSGPVTLAGQTGNFETIGATDTSIYTLTSGKLWRLDADGNAIDSVDIPPPPVPSPAIPQHVNGLGEWAIVSSVSSGPMLIRNSQSGPTVSSTMTMGMFGVATAATSTAFVQKMSSSALRVSLFDHDSLPDPSWVNQCDLNGGGPQVGIGFDGETVGVYSGGAGEPAMVSLWGVMHACIPAGKIELAASFNSQPYLGIATPRVLMQKHAEVNQVVFSLFDVASGILVDELTVEQHFIASGIGVTRGGAVANRFALAFGSAPILIEL